MERYLTDEQITEYPIERKYKKTSYGGRKVFIKNYLPAGNGKYADVEFFFRYDGWKIDKKEKIKAIKNKINNSDIKKTIKLLNRTNNKKVELPLNKKQYDELYYKYADADSLGYYESNSPEYIRVKDILSSINNGSLVYDVGCNSGGIGKLLIKNKNCIVFGSEISPELVKKAKKKGIKTFCGWAEDAPFEDNFFDYIILSFILEHVIDPKKLMLKILKTLKKGGTLIGHVPTEFGDWGHKTIGVHPEHLRAFSKGELIKLFKKFKLKNIIIKKEKLIGRRIADYYFFKAIK